jgi:hypothetical protein
VEVLRQKNKEEAFTHFSGEVLLSRRQCGYL